jgi:hypothetical protein
MSFRALHDALLQYDGANAFAEVLMPWASQHRAVIQELQSFREKAGTGIPQAGKYELFMLYAASRVFELLVLNFQHGHADGSAWRGPGITEHQLEEFAQQVGLEVLRPDRFSPFHHEMVEVQTASQNCQSARICTYHWPCLMLGRLLFMRAGVSVSAGADVMHPQIAASSTLYWAHRRKNRPHRDLAQGWGRNSAWKTCFRRDYHLGDQFHFNVDGGVDLAALTDECRNEEGLFPHERMELVANRCFVSVAKDDSDLFPYDDRFSMCVDFGA